MLSGTMTDTIHHFLYSKIYRLASKNTEPMLVPSLGSSRALSCHPLPYSIKEVTFLFSLILSKISTLVFHLQYTLSGIMQPEKIVVNYKLNKQKLFKQFSEQYYSDRCQETFNSGTTFLLVTFCCICEVKQYEQNQI